MDRINLKKNVKSFSVVLLIISFILVVVWSFWVEPGMLLVRKVSINIPNWHKEHENLKIAVLTDFHIGSGYMDRKNLARIIEKTNAQGPDIVVLLGDYINLSSKNEQYLPYLADLGNFTSKYGVYAVLGNHESWQVRHKIRYYIRKNGVKLLENKAEKVTVNGKSFWIAGIEDLTTGYPDLAKTLNQVEDPKSPVILLTHNPDVFGEVPQRVSITLAGHTHGGQVYIPFLVRLITPSRFGRRFLKGHVVQSNRHILISSGLGTTIIPARFLVPPEIIILNLNKPQ